MLTKENIGQNIKKLREKSNLLQVDIAKHIGVTQQCMAAYETGRTMPDILTLLRIADYLKLPLNSFLTSTASTECEDGVEVTLSKDEAELVNNYRKLSKEKRAALLTFINEK